MSVRILVAVAAVTMSVGLFAATPRPSAFVPPSVETTAAEIDFDALHAEAAGALQALEQSREPRFVSMDDAAF